MALKENTITWLHLSDLHFCEPKTGWDATGVLQHLLEDLRTMEKNHGLATDLLFFTGDLAFGNYKNEKGWNLQDQYEGVAGFLESVRAAFQTPVPKQNVFLVPGNHDVDRKTVSNATTAYLDGLKSEETVSKMIHETDQDWKDCIRRLDGFREFLKNHGYDHLLTDPEERLVYAVKRTVNSVEVGIAGLNTAWSCGRESSGEKGKLWMGAKWQTKTVESALGGADLVLALAHHPPNWMVEPEDIWLGQNLPERFQFFLHGHEHSGWVGMYAY